MSVNKCRTPGCDQVAPPGRLRCSMHDHRTKVPPDPSVSLGRTQPMRGHPDGFPTFAPPVRLPEGLRRKLVQGDALDAKERELVLQLVETGLAAVNLRRAEADYGRRELLLRATHALRLEIRAVKRADALIEQARADLTPPAPVPSTDLEPM